MAGMERRRVRGRQSRKAGPSVPIGGPASLPEQLLGLAAGLIDTAAAGADVIAEESYAAGLIVGQRIRNRGA